MPRRKKLKPSAVVQNCPLKFKCGLGWESLTPTSNPTIRRCEQCEREVHLVADLEQLAHATSQGLCAAVQFSK